MILSLINIVIWCIKKFLYMLFFSFIFVESCSSYLPNMIGIEFF
jgi:hypothetical protein